MPVRILSEAGFSPGGHLLCSACCCITVKKTKNKKQNLASYLPHAGGAADANRFTPSDGQHHCLPPPRLMRVIVHVKEKCVPVAVGEGTQPVRWLANVGIARHDDQQGCAGTRLTRAFERTHVLEHAPWKASWPRAAPASPAFGMPAGRGHFSGARSPALSGDLPTPGGRWARRSA